MSLTLRDLFPIQDDERIALSVVAGRAHDGTWQLVHGTAIVVPEACAKVSWPEWQALEGRRQASTFDPPLAPTFVVAGDTWLLGRLDMSARDSEEWLGGLLSDDGNEAIAFPAMGELPSLTARLKRPEALLQVLPRVDSPASSLVTGLGRPAQALLWTSAEHLDLALPQMVEVGQQTTFLPSRDLAGIHITSADVDPSIATAPGLLVGRAERRAWLVEAHGSGDFESYVVDVGWDPARADIEDLELTHVERLGKETVLSTRLRLEDVDVSAVRNAGRCAVSLPTIGRTVSHEVFLHTVDGELLDRSGPYRIVERVTSTMTVNGQTLRPVVHGISDPPPGLEMRLERQTRIEGELRALLRSGAQARMIADRQTALERLRDWLEAARGELLVYDRFFGQQLDEWRLLDGVRVPVRVLTAKIAKEEDGRPAPASIAAHVEARYRPHAPMHERFYVWDGGGLSVGGSPTTFGQAPVRIQRLRPADAGRCREEFDDLWASSLFKPVPRR